MPRARSAAPTVEADVALVEGNADERGAHTGRGIMTEARKVAAFRKRLASRKINWVIDIPVRRRITVELTRQQQQLLRRVTRQQIRSLTLAVILLLTGMSITQ